MYALRATALLAAFLSTWAGAHDRRSDAWTATDALGRTLPTAREAGSPRKGKFVGIFYFLWMQNAPNQGLYDISKLLLQNPADPAYGPVHAFHWWGEPHLGYYLSDDAFVIRKHAQMLTDAGVDVMFFDVTNAFTYDATYLTICRVLREVRAQGRPTPQIAFLANASSAKVVQGLYDRFYAKGLYPELWFRWKGKPLILTPPQGLSPEVKGFFTTRWSWAWSDPGGWFGDGRDRWPWLDHTPQKPGWHESPEKPEAISVATAEHATTNIGRSFHNGKQPPPETRAPERGLYFDEQWRRARQVDPEFVFVTGWNEWIAQRFLNEGDTEFLGRRLAKGETFFVDQYNQEYSRDIEPMRGGHGDNYYYQLVANIRRYKGMAPPPAPTPRRTIRLRAGFGQWRGVRPEHRDDAGDAAPRDHAGFGTAGPYRSAGGRHDFVSLKACADAQTVAFYARTRAPITAPGGPTWMTLLLNTDGNARTGWEGYDLIVNRIPGVVERNAGGWRWTRVGTVRWESRGNELHLIVPRKLIGGTVTTRPLRFEFKWIDRIPESGDILDFIDKGDAAPNGRFNYVFEEAPAPRRRSTIRWMGAPSPWQAARSGPR